MEGDNALGSGEGRVEIDKDAVSGRNQGVNKINATVSNNYSNITMNMGNNQDSVMYGPKVNILGNEVNLFELNIGFNVPSSGIYMESCYEPKKQETEVLIGYQAVGESIIHTGDREKVGKYKEAYEEVKKAYYAMGNKKEFTRRYN